MEKISRDAAEADFDRWADNWRIDTDREGMDDEDRDQFDNMRRRVVANIVQGWLLVSESGSEIEHKLEDGEAITYKIPKGAAWLTMDQHKEKQGVHKSFSYLASMAGRPLKFFSGMDGRDVKVAQDIVVLFLA